MSNSVTMYISRAGALRLVRFEDKRYNSNLLAQFGCDGNPARLLRLVRTQLGELCCYDGSKLLWGQTQRRWIYYQY